MKKSVYFSVVRDIDNAPFDSDECLRILTEKYPEESVLSLRSIVSQQYQRRTQNSISRMRAERRELHAEYLERVASGGEAVLVQIARERRYSPAELAKIVLEEHVNSGGGSEEKGIAKEDLRKLLRNTALIDDARLALEVTLCQLKDNNYGISSEAISHCVGEEHEQLIKQELQQRGIAFQDERYFRARGYDKTPDIKLEIPVLINGRPVNWIESKALFGDVENHKSYLKNQLQSYWNRFGAGLVIYWSGFRDDLNSNSKFRGIQLADSFPKDIVEFDPSFGTDRLLLSDEDEDVA